MGSEFFDYNQDGDILDVLIEKDLGMDYCGALLVDGYPSGVPDGDMNDTCYEYVDLDNVVTAIPAFYAENVGLISNFDDADEDFGIPAKNKLWSDSTNTAVGNGGIYFQIINPYNIPGKLRSFFLREISWLIF